jgi:hypothetical protein
MLVQGGVVLIVGLLLLGWSLQLEWGAAANTTVKIIDLILNLLVFAGALGGLLGGGRYALFYAFFAYRSLNNISPLIRIMLLSINNNDGERGVVRSCLQARMDYNIIWERKFKNTPVIYIANHALWCLDDIVALGALAGNDLSIIMNTGPAGLRGVPDNCRKFLCVINRDKGSRGEGYRIMENIIERDVLEEGKSIVVFAENMKTKSQVGSLSELRTGIFKLAYKYRVPIVPLWINWPCQFPTIINPCDKTLIITEGGIMAPENFSSDESLRESVGKCLKTISIYGR